MRTTNKKSFDKNNRMTFFSAVIIIVVFSTVLTSSFLILRQSFISDNSNFKLAAVFIHKQSGIANADSSTLSKKIFCKTFVYDSGNDSIVDFLNENKMESSFEVRLNMAKEAGINHYIGSGEENRQLLRYLVDKFSKENDCHKISLSIALFKGLWQDSQTEIFKD
jgi:hypothetical protein